MSTTIFLVLTLSHNPFDPQWPLQSLQRFRPYPMVVTFGRNGDAWCHLPFAPDPQNTGMREIDTSLTVKPVETFDDVVRIARPA